MMFPTTNAAKTKPGHARARLRLVIGLLAAFFVLIGQSAPGMAGTDLSWIEICGEAGAEYAVVDGGTAPGHDDCVQCDCCLVGSGHLAVPVRDAGFVVAPSDCGDVRGLTETGFVPVAAEQFWAATRGPPETEEDCEKMTLMFLTNEFQVVGAVTGRGVAPCA